MNCELCNVIVKDERSMAIRELPSKDVWLCQSCEHRYEDEELIEELNSRLVEINHSLDCDQLFLSFVNDFLTVEAWKEYHKLSDAQVKLIFATRGIK